MRHRLNMVVLTSTILGAIWVLLGDFESQAKEAFLNKLDPQLTRVLEQGESAETRTEPLVVMIQFSETPNESLLSKLKEINVQVQSVVGDVSTASVPATSLGQLSQIDEVIYVESSQRLFFE